MAKCQVNLRPFQLAHICLTQPGRNKTHVSQATNDMRELVAVPGNAGKMESKVTTQIAMGLPKGLACEKSLRRSKNQIRGVDINHCSNSSPTPRNKDLLN